MMVIDWLTLNIDMNTEPITRTYKYKMFNFEGEQRHNTLKCTFLNVDESFGNCELTELEQLPYEKDGYNFWTWQNHKVHYVVQVQSPPMVLPWSSSTDSVDSAPQLSTAGTFSTRHSLLFLLPSPCLLLPISNPENKELFIRTMFLLQIQHRRVGQDSHSVRHGPF